METADRYNAWLTRRAFPHLGRRVLDAGAGIGTHTAAVADGSRTVVAAEPEAAFTERLLERFGGRSDVDVVPAYATDLDLDEYRESFDSIICFNVLEHIPDHAAALAHFREMLVPGGRLMLIVPAHPVLYGSIDEVVEHERRYSRRGLRSQLMRADLRPDVLRHVNPIGAAGWLVSSRILKRRSIPARPLAVYDRLVPVLRAVDRVDLRVGLSLWAVASRPIS